MQARVVIAVSYMHYVKLQLPLGLPFGRTRAKIIGCCIVPQLGQSSGFSGAPPLYVHMAHDRLASLARARRLNSGYFACHEPWINTECPLPAATCPSHCWLLLLPLVSQVSVKISDLFPDEGPRGPQSQAQMTPPPPGSGRKLKGQHTQTNSKLLQAPTAQAAAAGLFSSMLNRKLLHAAASTSSVPAASSRQLSWSLQYLNQGHHASQRKLAQRPSGIDGWLDTASSKDRENYKALQESVRGSSGSSSRGGRGSTRPSIADVESPPGHRRLLAAHYGHAVEHGSSSGSNLEHIGVQPQTGFHLFARNLAAAAAVPAGSIFGTALPATSGTASASATAGNSRSAATKTKEEQVKAPVKPSTVGDAAQTSQLEPSPLVKATGSAADETPRSTRRDDLSQWAEGAPVDAQKGLAEIGATKLTTGRQKVKLTDLGLDPKP